MSPKLFSLLILLSLCSLSCEDNTILVANADALVDPKVAPRIIFTYPPLNSSGPYLDWEIPSTTYPPTRFEMRFNKIMDRASVKRALRLTSSIRSITLDTAQVYDNGREYFFFTPTELYAFPPAFLLGELLTLSFSQPVADVNGNLIPAGVLGTFRPEPNFRVQSISPLDGSILDGSFPYVLVSFNSKIDSSILPFVSTSAALGGSWTIGSDSLTLYLSTAQMAAAESYTVTVSAGAPDKAGHRSVLPFTARYQSTPFRVTIRSGGGPQTALSATIGLTFSFAVDTSTFRRAFHLTPAVNGGIVIASNPFAALVRFTPKIEYSESTLYVVRIDTSLRSSGGSRLSEEYGFAFQTASFRSWGTFPSDGSVNVSTSTGISAEFTAILDSSTIRRSFHISPPTIGLFPYLVSPTSVYFYPADTLIAHQTYTVTIDTTVRSRSGFKLRAPVSFSFTTGSN